MLMCTESIGPSETQPCRVIWVSSGWRSGAKSRRSPSTASVASVSGPTDHHGGDASPFDLVHLVRDSHPGVQKLGSGLT